MACFLEEELPPKDSESLSRSPSTVALAALFELV